MKRGGRLNPMSAKRRRSASQRAAFTAAVKERCGGLCETRNHRGVKADCHWVGSQAHHVLRRSQGGTDTANNLLWLCAACHQWVHNNPEAARGFGLLRSRYESEDQ